MRANAPAIQIRGVGPDTALHMRAATLLRRRLERLGTAPVSGRASFSDENGPKGGRAMRCTLTVRLPYRPTLRVERTDVDPRRAFDAAVAVLDRELKRYREVDRERRRHPKKYFAARRALAGAAPRAPRRRARAS